MDVEWSRSTSASCKPVLLHDQQVDVTCLLWWRFEAWEVIKDTDEEKDGLGCYEMQVGERQATLTN